MRSKPRKEIKAVGFFRDIINDSKRPVGRSTAAAVPQVTSAPVVRPPNRRAPREFSESPHDSLNNRAASPPTFWEEEVGPSRAARTSVPPSEPEDRQVVGPSLSENTETSELARAPEKESSSPAIGKWKQIGLKNRRDVTVRSRMRRDQNLHSLVSFGKEVYHSEDSSVVEPAAKHSGQNARGKSVEATHRSRQAGPTARAGATTPPISITPDRTASTPSRPLARTDEKIPSAQDERAAPSNLATPSETVAPAGDAIPGQRPDSQIKTETPPIGPAPPRHRRLRKFCSTGAHASGSLRRYGPAQASTNGPGAGNHGNACRGLAGAGHRRGGDSR